MKSIVHFFKVEYGFIIALALLILFLAQPYIAPAIIPKLNLLTMTLIIVLVMLACSFNVIKHADWLAEKCGEPYGTLILTISICTIEAAIITTMMIKSKGDPTLARDTMFAVIMLCMNCFAGLSLLTGGIKHRRQQYNCQGANTYLAVLIPLSVFCLILPNYTISSSVGTLSPEQLITLIIICAVLYISFLITQTITHRDYFQFSIDHKTEPDEKHKLAGSLSYHVGLLILGLIVMVSLSKSLGVFFDELIDKTGLPIALGGLVIALLVLLPEGVSAMQAAYKNQLQRSVNLCMGSAIATICLTIPAVAIVSLTLAHKLVLGLNAPEMVILVLTFFISLITFSSRRTGVLNGVILLSIFFVYLLLIFD